MIARALAVLLCAVAASREASTQERATTALRVLDGSGRPLAGATVTFLGSEAPLGDRFAPADRVVAATNDKGRLRVELLPRASYACWAVGPPDDDGLQLVSAVVDEVRAGTGFEIQARAPRRASRLAVTGAEAWGDLGPLRFEAAVSAAHLHREPLRFVDGEATLPPLPTGAEWVLFVVDRDGALLHAGWLRPQTDAMTYAMPPPRELAVRAVDDGGAPVAGATIRLEVGRRTWRYAGSSLADARPLAEWRVVGATGADGTARVRVPCARDPFAEPNGVGPLLLAGKVDHAASLSGFCEGPVVDGVTVDALPDGVVPFTLRRAPSWRGRVLGDDGGPVAGVALELSAEVVLKTRGGGMYWESAFRTTTAADGKFCFDHLPPGLRAPMLMLPLRDGATTAPALRAPDLDLPLGLDLRQLVTVELRARDATGGPARHADVMLLPLPIGERELDHTTHRLRLDGRGAARVRVEPGRWGVAVTDGLGFACAVEEFAADGALALDLAELGVTRGVLRADLELPLQDARLRVNSVSHRSRPDERTTVLRALGSRLNQWLADRVEVQRDGAFTLRWLDVPDTTYSAAFHLGGRYANLQLRPVDEPVVVEFVHR